MILDSDAEFHKPDADKLNWAETNFFGFYNAEEKLNIGIYALFRTNLRTVNSTICMNSGFAATPWQADYVDYQSVLPMPEGCSLLDFKLANGLHIRCLEPNRVWHIRFDDGEGTRVDVTYEAIMPAFDIHDPAMDPMVGAHAGKFAWGTAYNGHFDQSGYYEGTVTLRGRTIPIACVSTMDHSWGPRPERGAPNMSWLHAHFSKDLAVHAIFSFDPEKNGRDLSLTHGYVVEKGEIFGLKAGSGVTLRERDRYASTVELLLVDRADREWRLKAEGLTSFPWQCWANMIAFNVLGRWEMAGLTGYGEIQDFFELPQLTRLNADPATRASLSA
ncbi:DUF7064 domain-containing protein [Zavarzinia compransoris]|uniref:DUF7064 domain-containing protein n=1 Tax=Zavarzinia compransoris TaxID=1264899 RepID=A0A317E3W6_9PROT|nr:hypothetical protein [Zavarzinia compransoris]PWR21679.1 hypothetical protein DKG75_06670 [Zavarzinia compransoris]TDP45538.1 hypothetical protein DES42_105245 [Zavarzinia compransoris]